MSQPGGKHLVSEREYDVLDRIAAGWSDKMIAKALGLSPATVNAHAFNIYEKMHLPMQRDGYNRRVMAGVAFASGRVAMVRSVPDIHSPVQSGNSPNGIAARAPLPGPHAQGQPANARQQDVTLGTTPNRQQPVTLHPALPDGAPREDVPLAAADHFTSRGEA